MSSAPLSILPLVGALLASAPVGGPAPAPTSPLVTAALLSEGVGVAPGGTQALAVRLVMAPGWHVYWSNPGESGLPTRASLTAPPGYSLGPVALPGPSRFTSDGGIINYGYGGEVWLLTTLAAPADAQVGTSARVSGKVSWLACNEACVPGSAQVELELPVVASPEPGPARSSFEGWRGQLPQPWEGLAGAQLLWEPSTSIGELQVRGAEELTLFETADSAFTFASQQEEAAAGTRRLLFRTQPAPGSSADPALRAVLRVKSAGAVRFYTISFPAGPPARTSP